MHNARCRTGIPRLIGRAVDNSVVARCRGIYRYRIYRGRGPAADRCVNAEIGINIVCDGGTEVNIAIADVYLRRIRTTHGDDGGRGVRS